MSIWREWFGPSRKELWQLLSEQTGSEFVVGGLLKADKVVHRYRGWAITLDTYTVSTGKSSTTYTRIRAPYVSVGDFRFSIHRSGLFSELGLFLGFQDIETGSEEFDKHFVVKSNCEETVRALLSDARLRDLIDAQPRFDLKIKDDEGWFGTSFPEDVDMLYFLAPGIIKDVEQLKQLFEIFSQVLDRLCTLGVATEYAPEIAL